MRIDERLSSVNFSREAIKIYGNDCNINEQIKRYTYLYKHHLSYFKLDKDAMVDFFSSPGRIEVCGNHTDHNNGMVVCASINVDTLACVTKTANNYVTVASMGYSPIVINLDDLDIKKEQYGNSAALVRGVLAYYKSKGYNIGPFDSTTTSSLFKGAGVSSSACFCLLVAQILNKYYNDNKISYIENAKAAQFAEDKYYGKSCGLMDQMAVAAGGVIYIDFKDLNDLKVVNVDWNFNDLDIVLINSGGSHSKLTGEYVAIKEEMNSVANYFGKDTLRFVDEEEFYKNIFDIQSKVNGRAILRAIHYFNENKRVQIALEAIQSDDPDKFLQQINESGMSSSLYLQNTMALGDLDERIPLAVSLAKNAPIKVEAVRVHGGGFAGTVLSFVKKENTDEYKEYMSNIFGSDNVFVINIRNVGAKYLEI